MGCRRVGLERCRRLHVCPAGEEYPGQGEPVRIGIGAGVEHDAEFADCDVDDGFWAGADADGDSAALGAGSFQLFIPGRHSLTMDIVRW